MTAMNCLLVGEASSWTDVADILLRSIGLMVSKVTWSRGDPFPTTVSEWSGDWIISFKSDLYLPESILERAKYGAINFHPGPPMYRGLGCYKAALANRDRTYGVTCHHMDGKLDHGPIISVKSFSIENVLDEPSLRAATAIHALLLLAEISTTLSTPHLMPISAETWSSELLILREKNSEK